MSPIGSQQQLYPTKDDPFLIITPGWTGISVSFVGNWSWFWTHRAESVDENVTQVPCQMFDLLPVPSWIRDVDIGEGPVDGWKQASDEDTSWTKHSAWCRRWLRREMCLSRALKYLIITCNNCRCRWFQKIDQDESIKDTKTKIIKIKSSNKDFYDHKNKSV